MSSKSKSKIFEGYKALGFVSNQVPLCIGHFKNRKDACVLTCVGQAFHTFNCSRLGITNISDSLAEPIQCLKTDKRFVFAASGINAYAFMQCKKIKYTYIGHDSKIHLLLPFVNHLITVDITSRIIVWNIDSQDIFSELHMGEGCFDVSALIHPHHYVNKVLFASRQGTMKLINLAKNKEIYYFKGWASPITALQQSPATDVVGIGMSDGMIVLHNLKFDETLMKFQQDWGAVTCLSFRTDNYPIMVAGSYSGHIGIWNLEERRLQAQVNEAHIGPVSGLQCLESQPIMFTSSVDNSLKAWIFDQTEGGARLYNQRLGHSAPPCRIKFHGTDGKIILSSGLDSTLQSFSVLSDHENRSLGRASYNKAISKKVGLKKDKLIMPPIVDFVSETSRQSDWDGILACHRYEIQATTWNFNRYTMGSHKFLHTDFMENSIHSKTYAQCVCISSCGNFGIVGYSCGRVDIFNMQSGLHRGNLGNPLAHDNNVTGVFSNVLNNTIVTLGRDCKIKFWNFKNKNNFFILHLEVCPTKGFLLRDNDKLAIALDNFTVIIVDIETKKIVRKFEEHQNDVSDLAFTSDGRWLITSSLDGCVRVFDVKSSILLDVFRFLKPVTSLTISPTSTYLATTHVDDLGIYLWTNKRLFTDNTAINKNIDVKNLKDYPDEIDVMDMPATTFRNEDYQGDFTNDLDGETYAELQIDESPMQLNKLVTLSNLPSSRWLALLNFDIIKDRNKPKDPPKVPKLAPFFLPTTPGLEFTFAPLPQENLLKQGEFVAKISKARLDGLLKSCLQSDMESLEKQYENIAAYLKSLGPSAMDVELRCLSLDFGGSGDLLKCCLDFLKFWIQSVKDHELASAVLARFLKLHGSDLVKDSSEEMSRLLEHTIVSVKTGKEPVQESLQQILCLVTYNRASAI